MAAATVWSVPFVTARQEKFAYQSFPFTVRVHLVVIPAVMVVHHVVARHKVLIQEAAIQMAEMEMARTIRFVMKDLRCHRHQPGSELRQDCLTRIFTGRLGLAGSA